MLLEMVCGAGIFVMGTLFGYICTSRCDDMELQFKYILLQDKLDECEKRDKEK